MTSTTQQPVLQQLDEHGVLLVTFNRPHKKNAFDDAQWDAASQALRDAQANPRVAAVVVTGAGDAFSAGVDLSSFTNPSGPRTDGHASAYHAFMAVLVEFDKPLLAAAKGVGIGIGCTLLFHCDVVYVGESVRLRLPFVSLGLVPEGASSAMLEAVVGARQAAELFFAAEWIDAARAVETGIATRAFPDAELLDATLARARDIAKWPVGSLQATKRTLLAARKAKVELALRAEDEGMRKQAGSPENLEAVRAFMEKRAPDFRKLRG
ncbi:MAG TPA: enoyl-CoA hydratase-related protein [Myxococcota bacterium]|nr:enoyl-CoA hydratase-related protein [Myxococcota bacterium]